MNRTLTTTHRLAIAGLAAVTTAALTVVPVLAATKTTKAPAKPAGKSTGSSGKGSLIPANGRPPKPAAPFLWDVASPDPAFVGEASFEAATTKIVPNNKLLKLLIIGSDARPGEPVARTRADSIHLLVWNPAFNKGILVGFPRDSIVPTKNGERKLTETLATDGPEYVVDAINRMSGLGVQNYVITGFGGFRAMIDGVGGINVFVKPSMNDVASGARFAEGWHAMDGGSALAFARNRKGLKTGDFGRSYNQGALLLYGLAKLREETSDAIGLVKWLKVLQANSVTNLKPTEMLTMAQIARSIDPTNMQNVVLSGKAVKLGKGKKAQDAIRLNPGYVGFFQDVSRDAVNDGK